MCTDFIRYFYDQIKFLMSSIIRPLKNRNREKGLLKVPHIHYAYKRKGIAEQCILFCSTLDEWGRPKIYLGQNFPASNL